MPVKYIKGSIFEAETDAVVNTVNCKGVMGKGLALEFKKRFPEMYEAYKKECERGRMKIGYIHLYEIKQKKLDTHFRFILNFPTKNDWRHKSKKEYIKKGLEYFRKHIKEYLNKGIKSVAFPQLGCQYGGLNWERDVKPLIGKYLKDLELDVYVYFHEPSKVRIRELRKNQKNITIEGEIRDPLKKNVPTKEYGDSILIKGRLVNDTGSIPLEIWGTLRKHVFSPKEGDKVRLTRAYIKSSHGELILTLSLDRGGKIEKLPEIMKKD